MTQAEFNSKPLRLRPADLREILDLGYDGVSAWLESHPQVIIETMPGGKKICSKAKVAKVLGFDV